jgi:spore photoproduct lyase
MKIIKEEYVLLDGTKKKLVKRVGDGSIITRFDKTPLPKKAKDVVCPHFLELKWATGCFYNCAWCYLQGTFRFLPYGKKPRVKPYRKIAKHISEFLKDGSTPELLNAGELSDSLLSEGGKKPFSTFILELMSNQNKHKVLFVTKSEKVENLIEIADIAKNKIILSWSMNAHPVAERWEVGAPPVEKRIEAARLAFEAGYTVRVRIDPMVPVKGWMRYYANLVDEIFENFTPERITVGSLRGLQTTINNAWDKSWVEYLSERTNWGKRIDFKTRYEMYRTIFDYLKKEYYYTNIALCKETKEMWEKLGADWKNIKCNCLL